MRDCLVSRCLDSHLGPFKSRCVELGAMMPVGRIALVARGVARGLFNNMLGVK